MTLAGLVFVLGSQIELVTVEEKKISESSKGPFYMKVKGCIVLVHICLYMFRYQIVRSQRAQSI